MSCCRSEPQDVAGVVRIPRWQPYSHPSPAAPDHSSGSSPTSPDSTKVSLNIRNTCSSQLRTPRHVWATRSAPLELAPVVRTEPGLPAPRRELETSLLSKQDKLDCARRLVARTVSILSTAWKVVETGSFLAASISAGSLATPGAPTQLFLYDGLEYHYQATTEHIPLRQFLHEILRRSCTNFVTLQTALCYLEAVAKRLPALVKDEASRMLKRASPGYICPQNDEGLEVPALPSPLLCPRRTLLASIILAAKFLQDRSFSNRSWAKLTGLAAREIGRSERALCAALDYRLWVGKDLGPVPTIEGLDMAPVIAKTVAYVPEPERAVPQMLRNKRGDVGFEAGDAAVDTPSPHPALPLARSPTRGNTAPLPTLPGFKTLAAGIDDPAEDPSRLGGARLVRLLPMLALAPTGLRPSCLPSQGAGSDDAPASSADVVSPSDAGPQGLEDNRC